MTAAAFVLLAVLLIAVWPDPQHIGHYRGSDSRRARAIVIAVSWVFVALAAWWLSGPKPPEAVAALTVGCWLIPGIWAMERADTFGEGCYALFMAPVAVCCASVIGLARRARFL